MAPAVSEHAIGPTFRSKEFFMHQRNRRQFLADVGRGMLVAGVGTAVATDLGLAPALAEEASDRITFGSLEPLVSLMQEVPADKLLPVLAGKIQQGADLKTLVSAAALANARTFGGEDYIGFHTLMALAPAYEMAQELPADVRPLPVLKVLYRNTNRIQEHGGPGSEVLHHVHAVEESVPDGGPAMQAASRTGDMDRAEAVFARLAEGEPGEAFNHLQYAVQDEVDVHRVVLAWRAWAMLDFTGEEQAHTLLRQSLHYCVRHERLMRERNHQPSPIRELLPKLLDEHRLLSRDAGTKPGDDVWVDELARTILTSTREQAAVAAAAALAEGYSPEAVGEAMSLAANLLMLQDPGRPEQYSNAEKPPGSVHGDSVGVHASDAANAWRSIARVSNHRNAVASMIVGAFHTAGQRPRVSDELWPLSEHRAQVTTDNPEELLRDLNAAIRDKDQGRSCAVVARYAESGHKARPLFDVLVRYSTTEDGALHAEKYYRTVSDEFARTRPTYRWRQLIGLARVAASEYGRRAPGLDEACRLLDVSLS
jgi:hypothetical protein